MSPPRAAAVVGAGSWGTALANLLAGNGREVRLWARDPAVADAMRRDRRNPRHLSDVPLADAVRPTSDLEGAVAGAEVVVSVVPSHAVREVLAGAAGALAVDAVVVSASKGIENESLKRMTEVLAEVLPETGGRLAALSGPSFAREVAAGLPTAVTVAAVDPVVAETAREAFAAPSFRVYTSPDVVGVEIGGAVKNVIAIAAGIADGLGCGLDARAALVTRGLAEISRLGSELGGERLTFMGLAGLGDLVLTCTGDLSRNRTVGLRLGRGERLADVLADMDEVAEGVRTTRSVRDLARGVGVEMPIVEQVHAMLHDAKSPEVVVRELMTRDYKPEFEGR